MPKFPSKVLDGVTYDMTHRDALASDVEFEGETFRTLIHFSCHCFTEKFDAAAHHADVRYSFAGETRAFCVDRHALSAALPQYFQTLGNQTVYHTQKESFFFIRTAAADGGSVPYVVFFRSYKSNQDGVDVVINVSSAYPKPGMTSWASPVKFPRMVMARAKDRVLPLGPATKIKRA